MIFVLLNTPLEVNIVHRIHKGGSISITLDWTNEKKNNSLDY